MCRKGLILILSIILISFKGVECEKQKIGLIQQIPLTHLVPYELDAIFKDWKFSLEDI